MSNIPPPPMPSFARIFDDLNKGDHLYDDIIDNATVFHDDPYMFSSEQKDDFQKELKQLEEIGAAPELLTDAQAEQECIKWKTEYSVVPGASWGKLPSDLQQKWLEYSCDYFLLEKA